MIRSSLTAFLIAMFLCVAAYGQDDMWSPGFVDSLRAKARELAEREMAKFNAIELMYRRNAELHMAEHHFMRGHVGVHLKMYRHFTDYEILDIYRSDSLLYPVTFKIHYNYDLLATDTKLMSEPDAYQRAQAERVFNSLGQYNVVRYYGCDREGNWNGELPELPPRPNYYTRGWALPPEPGAPRANTLPPAVQPVDTLPQMPGMAMHDTSGMPPMGPAPGMMMPGPGGTAPSQPGGMPSFMDIDVESLQPPPGYAEHMGDAAPAE